MAGAASVRWGAFRSIAVAIRTAARPGTPGLVERLRCVPRLVGATLRGQYGGTSRARLLLVLGAVAYVVSPLDLMPEAVMSVFGLGDDALVVAWVAASLVNETERFLTWETDRARTVPGYVVR